jgi:adenylate kinase
MRFLRRGACTASRPEIIRDRLKVYHDKTKPLIEYYSNKDILLTVDGQKNIEETKDHVFSVLGIMERL